MPLINLNLLTTKNSVNQPYLDAFNFWFDVFITFGVYTLPIWAVLRLTTRF